MKRVMVLPLASIVFSAACEKPIEIEGILDIPGAVFEYTAEGSGIPCVVFSGSENIGHQLYTDELREHIMLIHADPTNLAPERLETLSLEDITRDIDRVRMRLGVDKIAVMGHSMFGPVPLEYALGYPDRSLASIVTGAMPYTTTEALQAADEYWESSASDERKMIRESNHSELSQRDQSGVSPSDLFWDQYEADVPLRFFDPRFDLTPFREGLTTSVNMDFIGHYWGVLMREFDHTAEYGRIRSPVLVIAGKYDFGAPHFLWDGFGTNIPEFTFHLFEDAGHNPMIEVPQDFDRVVVEWIEGRN